MSNTISDPMDEISSEDFGHTFEEVERFIAQIAFGRRILALANDKSQGLGFVLEKARAAYLEAHRNFLNLNMQGVDGLAKAIALQVEMKRYVELVDWVDEAVKMGKSAEDELKGMRRRRLDDAKDEPLTEEQENYYGTERPEPAGDGNSNS